MSTSFTARLCTVLSVAIIVVQGSAATVKNTPIEKVVVLLKDLSTKIHAEGQKEAAQYDKFACFCKEQADEKQYAMEKSDEKTRYLKAERDELESDVAGLTHELSNLEEEIEKLSMEIEAKTANRRKDYNEYKTRARKMNEAIASCAAAIDALKGSKKEMLGAKLDLVQVTAGLVEVVKSQPLLAKTPETVALLAKVDQKGAPKFQYHSNDIIAALEDLHTKFKEMEAEQDVDEGNAKQSSDSNVLDLSFQKKIAQKASAETAAIVHEKEEQTADRVEQIKEEELDHSADWEFMKRLTDQCQDAAETFDTRSKTRADELTALRTATDKLESGAVENYKGNAKLVGLQRSAVGKAGRRSHDEVGSKLSSPATFVQINSVQHQASGDEVPMRRVQHFLTEMAERTGSPVLSAIAVRVGVVGLVQEDHFSAVRELIYNLLKKLENDKKLEATQKGECDDGIKEATGNRDNGNKAIELATAQLTTLNANKESLVEANREATVQIAELKKALRDAAELTKENVDNLKDRIKMCDAGKAAVDFAIKTLTEFYPSASLLQKKGPSPGEHGIVDTREYDYKQDAKPEYLAGADREGNTMGDIAPKIEQPSIATEESKGIIGILEVITSDFERSSAQATRDKTEAEEMQDDFKKDTDADVEGKTEKIDKNDGTIAEIDLDIIDEDNDLRTAKNLLESAMDALEDWHAMCVKGEETWEQRAQKRKEEVEALKQALNILDEWQR